jgi:flagellin
MNSINTNLGALTAQKNMQTQNAELSDAMARLSSGLRINSAADDAAGSAIVSKMESQVRSLDVAVRNSYDAISMTQTAEGALGEMENILQRVRELAVQASNSTLSSNDRVQIQAEVDSLVSEIDKIAASTHFNNVKLLDGSNDDVTFQIGINATDGLKVNLDKTDSGSLGLTSSSGVQKLTSERVFKGDYSTDKIAAADVKINGFNAFAADFSAELDGTNIANAKAIADAINANTGVHGATANAFNTLTSAAMGPFNMSQTFTIGETGNTNTIALASSYSGLVDNINEAAAGVVAKLNADNTITLSNTSGDDIVISANATAVGFTAGTYAGFVELENIDDSAIRIEAGSVDNGYTGGSGTIADVQAIGFNEFSVGGVLETDVVSGTALTANEIKINDVLIGESLNGSAQSIAAAINEQTAAHGVTANATNEIDLTLDFAAKPSSATAFRINGTSVDLTSALDASTMITNINNKGIGDIRATMTDTGGVKLTSASGVDIVVSSTDNDFVVSSANIHGDSITTGINNGTFDLDGFLDAATATASGVLNTGASALIGQVVNSKVVLTQMTNDTMAASNAVLKVTGTDSTGAALTESLTFTTAAIGDQISSTSVFHTVTQLEITGGAAHATGTFDVGLIGNSATSYDLDALHTTTSNDAAGSITLAGAATTNATALNGAVITFSGLAGDYSSSTVTFTITGTDVHGATATEDVILNVNAGEVHGTTAFHTVTDITSNKVLQSAGVSIGFAQVGDRVSSVGNMTLQNETTGPIKIQSVGDDTNTLMTAGGAQDTILQKLGIQNQSQSQEVSGKGVDVSNLGSANGSLAVIDKAIDQISLFRSSFGAVENRIDSSISNLTTLKVNTEAAKSRIQDADFAAETSKLTKSQILAQAATTMLAQANASKQNLLALLQG